MNPLFTEVLDDDSFFFLKQFIEGNLGIRIPETKRIFLQTRLSKRLRALDMNSYQEYCQRLLDTEYASGEVLEFVNAITTNTTIFFRESDHFEYLLHQALCEVTETLADDDKYYIWSAGASSGKEAYTLAMIMEEYRKGASPDYAILATDVSQAMLNQAKAATYTEDDIQSIPESYRSSYLLRHKNPTVNLYRIKSFIRERMTFGLLNFMDDIYPFKKKFHIIFCRNVLIYFDNTRQRQVIRRLYSYLRPGGFLFLGHAETLAGLNLPFENVAPSVFRKPQ